MQIVEILGGDFSWEINHKLGTLLRFSATIALKRNNVPNIGLKSKIEHQRLQKLC
ncbi:MAG: hypothetical protein U7127_26350 [Phormidium sp.]